MKGEIIITTSPIFITIVGSKYHAGSDVLRVGQIVELIKDYDNPYDDEAIRIELEDFGKIGYVANSTQTVARGTRSSGRIYDLFVDSCYAEIKFILKGDAIAELLDIHPNLIDMFNLKTKSI